MQIEINSDGLPTFTLQKDDAFLGNGSERIGYGDNAGGPKPFVNFYPKTLPMPAASLAAGKPVFKSVVFMRLQHPGERDCIDRPATREDATKYPVQYRQYCEGRQGIPDGIPLDTLFPNHQDVREALNFQRVYTVEQLAQLNDTQLQNLGLGGYEWQQKAKRYLEAIEKGQGFAQHEEQIRKMTVQLDQAQRANGDLARQVAKLTEQLSQLLSAQTIGQAPGLAAMPMHMQQHAAPAPLQHDGLFVRPGAGELAADDPIGRPIQPSGMDQQPDPAFLNEAAAAAAPETSTARRRRQ